jgi:restriction endonuclease S subunit
MIFKDLIHLTAGSNRSRLADVKDEEQLYSLLSIEEDLGQMNLSPKITIPCFNIPVTKEGDVIISNFKAKAAIVTKTNSNKILTSNFCKCAFDASLLDPWFFCYFINESDEFKRQLAEEGLRAVSPLVLSQINISLPPLTLQKKVGQVYKAFCRRRYLNDKLNCLYEKLILQSINNEIK